MTLPLSHGVFMFLAMSGTLTLWSCTVKPEASVDDTAVQSELEQDRPPSDTSPGGDSAPCELATLYYDGDGDGHGDPSVSTYDCIGTAGWAEVGDDCDDTDPDVWEGCADSACLLLGVATHLSEDGSEQISSEYWYCSEEKGWQEARQACFDTLSGDLLALNLAGETSSLQQLGASLEPDVAYWVGLYQPDTSPSVDFGWTWVDAQGNADMSTLDEEGMWHSDQPDNGGFEEGGGEDLEEDIGLWLMLKDQWGMADTSVSEVHPFLCEVHPEEEE